MLMLLFTSPGRISAEDAPDQLSVKMDVDFGKDTGQNFGSLFEIYDREGNVVAGAGFLGAYNTQPRSDRGRLHFFLKPKSVKPEVTELSRVNLQTGVYLSDLGDSLYARTRNGPDSSYYRFNRTSKSWKVDPSVSSYNINVAGKLLVIESKKIVYGEQIILDLTDSKDFIGENYYANGHLFLKLLTSPAKLETNRLVAIPWSPDEKEIKVDRLRETAFPLRSDREFVYSFGQLENKTIAATNTGGVYVFDGKKWEVLFEPDMKTSFQIYSIMNYYDRLLMGHYPTGELYSYDGQKLTLLKNWPPVMQGVSGSAREAQSLAIYGGDLYSGVWPWGEVWRYDRNNQKWNFTRRMFSHPQITDKVTHPYEAETKKTNTVYNLWGQRVTSLVPFDDSLYVSTSSKSGFVYDKKYDFLSQSQWEDYGKVYKLTIPGQFSVPTRWKNGPTSFEFTFNGTEMVVHQDGQLLGKQTVNSKELLPHAPADIQWGRGVYGSFAGDILKRKSNLDRPLIGAYLNLGRLLHSGMTVQERKDRIDQAVARFASDGFNTLCPYVTDTSGNAYYSSKLINKNKSPDFDVVGYVIKQAHANSLDVYPVFCVLACSRGILLEHPEWALRTLDAKPMGHICPMHPAARKWITETLHEFVSLYPTQGILLDYLRYYNRPTLLDEASLSEYNKWASSQPASNEKELMQQFKEQGISKLAHQISQAVRAVRPGIKIAIYSWGPHVAKNHQVAQPWPLWSQRGDIDMVNISGYCYRDNYGDKYLEVFTKRIADAVKLNQSVRGRADVTFCLGVETSHGKVTSATEINDYLKAASQLEINGTIFFTWNTIQPYLEEMKQKQYISEFVKQIQD